MLCQVPEDFQRSLDEFNVAQGGPSRVEVCWNAKTNRWEVWAIPQGNSSHPLARNDVTRKLLRPFPDHSGRVGIKLFTWCQRDAAGNDVGYEPLDQRVFHTLRWADSFADKRHFEKTFEEPEARKELARKQRLRDIVGGAREYWWKLDKMTINMNPEVRQSGDWRAKQPWR